MAGGCDGSAPDVVVQRAALVGAPADPGPTISFTQGGRALGLVRSNEPASASACPSKKLGSLPYGTWLSDFDGDGDLDVYSVNHGQDCHLSGLWLNDAGRGFGTNLWSVAVGPAASNPASMDLSNEVKFVGDLTGDGRVDIYFLSWSSLATMCVNTGNVTGSDWSGPSFACYQSLSPRGFADVNGDGKMDVLVIDSAAPDNPYRSNLRLQPTMWRLNNGDPNINKWPTDSNPFHFVGLAAPGALLDFNKDGYPDKIWGVEVPPAERGPYATSSGGLRVELGQADGTYRLVTSGLEDVKEPAVRFEDIDEDGCVDVGTDRTVYRDNQEWYVQDRSGTTCLATFHAVARTALPYYPGFSRTSVDVDNDGLLDKVVVVHSAYGHNDNKRPGVHIIRKLPAGGWVDIGSSAGININGTSSSEFYADQLHAGDWNDDGKVDFAGLGHGTIEGTDQGIALWTSNLVTTNHWLKVRLPSVTGFFKGVATIEIFDAGFADAADHLVTPARTLRAAQAWATQAYHFGVGARSSVDVAVTFPDGSRRVVAGVAVDSTISVSPSGAPAPPTTSPPPPVPPPTIAITSLTITPAVTGSAPVASVLWSVDGALQPPVSTAPFALTLAASPLAPGPHVVSCQAVDDRGQRSTAASVTISR
jgi:hypothetical protein